MIDFLDFLQKEDPLIAAGAALQGLAGLQLQEALRLTWEKVNFQDGLIEVSGIVKNEYRNRVIPIADKVLSVLLIAKNIRNKIKFRDMNDSVVFSPKGFSYCGESWINYSKRMRQLLDKWNPGINWKPKDLRNCLPTYAIMNGIHNDIWVQYIGHAPRSITARHYIPRLASVSTGENSCIAQSPIKKGILIVVKREF